MNAHQDGQLYTIEFSEQTCSLCITLAGFWEPATATRFKAEILDALKLRSAKRPISRTLIDQRGFSVQSADTVRILNEIFFMTRTGSSGRLAIVTDSTLAKLQVERNLADPRVRVFSNLGLANAWLDEAIERPSR